jgi:hypothetical protein
MATTAQRMLLRECGRIAPYRIPFIGGMKIFDTGYLRKANPAVIEDYVPTLSKLINVSSVAHKINHACHHCLSNVSAHYVTYPRKRLVMKLTDTNYCLL